MRPLSKLEKAFINHVLELDKASDLIYVHNVLTEIYDKNYEIEFKCYEKNAQKEIAYLIKLRYKKDGKYIRLNGIIGDLISLSYFIDDLLNQGYLVKEKIEDILGDRYINRFEDRSNLDEFAISSNTIKTKFAENLQYKFYATELLRELKANNYITFEKKEAKITRWLAIISLIIAVLSAITGTIIPLVKQDTVEIDKKSIDYFYQSEKQLKLIDTTFLKKPDKERK
jgi:hypothetical protein